VGTHFDELSKALANGRSRQAALKRFAAGVAGALFATVLPGRAALAVSNDGDVGDCDRDCSHVFERPGPQWRQCVVDCTRCRARGHHFYFLNESPVCITNNAD
jgi:hypothetical protein